MEIVFINYLNWKFFIQDFFIISNLGKSLLLLFTTYFDLLLMLIYNIDGQRFSQRTKFRKTKFRGGPERFVLFNFYLNIITQFTQLYHSSWLNTSSMWSSINYYKLRLSFKFYLKTFRLFFANNFKNQNVLVLNFLASLIYIVAGRIPHKFCKLWRAGHCRTYIN